MPRNGGEDTSGWKRLSGCCDLWIVEISSGAVITYSSNSWVFKWSVNQFTNPNPICSHSQYVCVPSPECGQYLWKYGRVQISWSDCKRSTFHSQKGIKSKLNLGRACCCYIQNLFSSSLLFESKKIKNIQNCTVIVFLDIIHHPVFI
jgi:hypothetical protein